MDSLIVSINCVIPVFITMLCGYYIRAKRIVPENSYPHLSAICFNVLLPVMMFHNVYSADYKTAVSPRLILFLLIQTAVVFLAAFFSMRFLLRDCRVRGAMIQNAYRTNIGVIGIALAQNLLSSAGVISMTVAIAVLIPVFNILAVITLEACRGTTPSLGNTLKSIAKNPLILGTLAGFAFVCLPLKMPAAIDSAIGGIAKAASVLTLIALGTSFDFGGLKSKRTYLLAGNALRLFAIPAIVITAAIAMGFRGDDLGVILICAASPLATPSFPMAQVYGSDYELTGALVVTTSLLCCFSMCLWIWLVKTAGWM